MDVDFPPAAGKIRNSTYFGARMVSGDASSWIRIGYVFTAGSFIFQYPFIAYDVSADIAINRYIGGGLEWSNSCYLRMSFYNHSGSAVNDAYYYLFAVDR